MATVTTSGPQQQVAMPAVDLRRMLAVGISAEGVSVTNDLLVSQRAAGANMSVDVAAGACYIADDHASGGGFYFARWDAIENVTVGASDPTNPRIDRIVVRVRDAFLGDAANDITLTVVAGTASAGATLANLTGAAAVPSSSLLLANVLIAAGGTTIADAAIGYVATPYTNAGSGMTRLYDSTLTAVAANFDATSLSGAYSLLICYAYLRGDTAATGVDAQLKFNNDGGANYDRELLYASAGTPASSESLADTNIGLSGGTLPANNAPASVFGSIIIEIPQYAATTGQKTVTSRASGKIGTASGNIYNLSVCGFWRSTAAINRVTITPGAGNWAIGSRLTILGIR